MDPGSSSFGSGVPSRRDSGTSRTRTRRGRGPRTRASPVRSPRLVRRSCSAGGPPSRGERDGPLPRSSVGRSTSHRHGRVTPAPRAGARLRPSVSEGPPSSAARRAVPSLTPRRGARRTRSALRRSAPAHHPCREPRGGFVPAVAPPAATPRRSRDLGDEATTFREFPPATRPTFRTRRS